MHEFLEMFWYLVKSRILLKFFGLESNGTLWPTSRAHNFGLKCGTGHRFCTRAPSNAPINILKDKNLADCPFKNCNQWNKHLFLGTYAWKGYTLGNQRILIFHTLFPKNKISKIVLATKNFFCTKVHRYLSNKQ